MCLFKKWSVIDFFLITQSWTILRTPQSTVSSSYVNSQDRSGVIFVSGCWVFRILPQHTIARGGSHNKWCHRSFYILQDYSATWDYHEKRRHTRVCDTLSCLDIWLCFRLAKSLPCQPWTVWENNLFHLRKSLQGIECCSDI